MSRIGRMPIAIPAGVTVTVTPEKVVIVKGPLGQLQESINSKHIAVNIDGSEINVTRDNDKKDVKSLHGLYRMLVANMVDGVTKGFAKKLIVNGVGYKCAMNGNKLVMNIGYSHPVEIVAPEGVTVACTTPTEIEVKGISKQAVGQMAAVIRAAKPVEPYHLYGIRYSDEHVQQKEGKTAGK